MPSSDLVTGYTSGPFRRAVSYEPHRDLIAAVTNAFGTTVFGLIVAIPALAAHAFFRRRTARRVAQLESLAVELESVTA